VVFKKQNKRDPSRARSTVDQFIAELESKEDPNESRSFSDGGWSFSANSPESGQSPISFTQELFDLGYDDDTIRRTVSKSYVGVPADRVDEFLDVMRRRPR
jgi:hypothetical protein